MKKIVSIIVVSMALWMASFGAYAQQTPTPPDTQARVGSNLVNQVSAANFKTVAEVPALQQNVLTTAAAAAASRLLNIATDNYAEVSAIRGAALAVALKSFQTMNAQESMALAKSMSADQAQQMQQLLAALNAGGIGTKTMQTVPPVSVAPPAGGQ